MNETLDQYLESMDGIAPGPPKAAAPFKPAVLSDTPPLPAPGIYFGMPEDIYRALPALGSTDFKRLAASPMIFWANCTWLSEGARKREAEKAAKADERAHHIAGRAYHCRILEGPAAYAQRYAVELSAEDCKDALESTDQIKAAIAAGGEKPVSKVPDNLPDGTAYMRSAVKADWTAQLIDIDPNARVLANLREQHARANAGKQFVPFEAHEQIEIAAKMIEADPQARHAIAGGYPEVTLIWHDFETGIPMKARIDRLKTKAAVDLKTIGNERGASIDRAIYQAVANYKYTVQAALYLEGIAAVRALVRANFFNAVYLPEDTADDVMTDWAIKWAAETDPPEWWWLFQAKGYAPITRLKRLPLGGATLAVTNERLRAVKRTFRTCAETYGLEPWLDLAPAEDINDDDLPPYVCDI